MHIEPKNRDSIYAYFYDVDDLIVGDLGATHAPLLYAHNYVEIDGDINGNYLVTKTYYEGFKHSFGYIIGKTVYIDLERTDCPLNVITKRLRETKKFTKVEFI